ncbi:annexin a7-like [Diplodia corticola]|uniref:Annexin a7-like n=1 Tax=Diplodia corticola TaxID=236234 RepID=A0A1J9RBV2_9PEZI|nr:annexin a7-like [Diplodia corticola]OJD29939.1 annexin a7-like [Diplodia corticola]
MRPLITSPQTITRQDGPTEAMSGQQSRNQDALQDERRSISQSGQQNVSQPAAASNLFNTNYRGPQDAEQQGQLRNTNASSGIYGIPALAYNAPVYNQFGQAPSPAVGRGRGNPPRQGGHRSRVAAAGGRQPSYSGRSSPYPPVGPAYSPRGYQQQLPYPPAAHRGRGHSGPVRFPPSAPAGRGVGPRGQRGESGRRRSPAPTPASSQHVCSAQFTRPSQPAPSRGRPAFPPVQFGKDDFPSLGSQSRQSTPRQQRESGTDQGRPAAGRGRGRGRYVPFTDFSLGGSTGPTPTGVDNIREPASTLLPRPRFHRNADFRLTLSQCYRGKIVFIDELSGLDYSGHPAVIRSVNRATRQIRFFKKSSFKGIGGFLNKYGEYVNQAQKRWHEKQWLLVDDGTTRPHHGTPLLRLADGEMMPEKGSYVDIHGDAELHVDYFSKYSRFGSFPDLYLPEEEMAVLERYSEWYLKKDAEYRQAEERRKREKWQVDESTGADVGNVYEDSENENEAG